MLTRRTFTQLSLFSLGLGLTNCSRIPSQGDTSMAIASDQADLVIWWEQGYLPEENEGIIQLVRQWEGDTGRRISLKLMHIDLLEQQLLKALAEPTRSQVPDIVFAISLDSKLGPKLAWQNQLRDMSSILEPVQDQYIPEALSQVTYRNNTLNERHYYAVPLGYASEYIHCWKNLLEDIGYGPQDIPKEWDGFWQFWQQAQQPLRNQGHADFYGLGLCMSASGTDTFTSLRFFLDAHNATVVNDDGELVLTEPDNRQRFIDVLREYTGFYQAGYVPPGAVDWTASGNNFSFLEGNLLMTHNPTLSIPLTQKLDTNLYNRDAIDRYKQIMTVELPLKPDGTPMLLRKGIKQAIVLQAGIHADAAQEFIRYLIQPDHLNRLLKDTKGRILPVMPSVLSDPYWHDPSDPHLSAALKLLMQPGLPPYETLHPAYSEIFIQQIWGKTVLKILKENASPEAAADWALAQMTTIWKEWEGKA